LVCAKGSLLCAPLTTTQFQEDNNNNNSKTEKKIGTHQQEKPTTFWRQQLTRLWFRDSTIFTTENQR
jgi:hypothetical protein